MRTFILSLTAIALAITTCASPVTAQSMDGQPPLNSAGIDPATAQVAVAHAMFAGQQQATDLLWPLRQHNVDRCSQTRYEIGFHFFAFPAAGDGDSMARTLGLVPGSSIDHVIPGSPVTLAGLQVGDRVLRIQGDAVATGRHAGAGSNALLDAASARSAGVTSVALDIEREGQALTIQALPVKVCAMTVASFSMAGPLGGGTPGQIDLDTRTLRDAQDDTDRTIILAHAMAHQLDGDASRRAGVMGASHVASALLGWAGHSGGGLIGLAAGAVVRVGTEERADLLSLDLLQSVGIPASRVLAFWQREATMSGDSTLANLLAAHPMTGRRLEQLRKEVAERPATTPAVQNAPSTPSPSDVTPSPVAQL